MNDLPKLNMEPLSKKEWDEYLVKIHSPEYRMERVKSLEGRNPGYRALGPNELIEDGDEFYNDLEGSFYAKWYPALSSMVGKLDQWANFRRKI